MDWKRLFDSLGMNGTQWQWRIYRWEEKWKDLVFAARQKKGTVTYQHKFCPACGSLMDHSETQCPRCGMRAPSWRAQVMKRVFGLVLPAYYPASTLLLVANLTNLLVMLLAFGLKQLLAPDLEALVRMGALVPAMVAEGQYFRLITYGYLHIGILHIGFNMLVLSQVGPVLEKDIGTPRFFSLYTLALAAAGGLDLLWRGPVMTVIAGASGALFGLIGFGASHAHFYGGPFGREQRSFYLRWALYGFVFGFMIGADNIAHLGGFLMGAVLGFLIERERTLRDRLTPVWTFLAYGALVLTVGSFVWLAVAG
ncbi:MAG: rhomboid family intramembrane serine protease [Kiritimatiellae bacterium]|nr:rhomboid family intramembrane serine protease [Kiritimatiellia bacterium]